MRILYYSPHPQLSSGSPTGYGTHIRETIAAMRALGHEVEELVMGGSNSLTVTQPPSGGIKKILRKIIPRYIWRSLKENRLKKFDREAGKKLKQVAAAFKPDLIYERMAYLQPSGSLAAEAMGVKYLLEVNAPLIAEVRSFEGAGSFYEAEATRCMKKQLETAHRIIVVSSALKTAFLKAYNIPENKFRVTPNCVHPEHLAVLPEVKTITEKLFEPQHRVIGFVGSVFPYHGVDLLLNAFAAIQKDDDNLRLLIVGDGYLLPELKSRAASLGCADKVVFTGPVPAKAVSGYIDRMEITVMARSNWYGSPVKIFEYGAMGKPVLAPDTVPVRDVMEHGIDGLLVEPDEQKIKTALLQLLHDTANAQQMARHFQKKVLEQFTWEKSVKRMLDEV